MRYFSPHSSLANFPLDLPVAGRFIRVSDAASGQGRMVWIERTTITITRIMVISTALPLRTTLCAILYAA